MGLSVEVQDLHLRYWGNEALRGLSFRIEADTICGLLGRNGSGKTSLLSLVASLRRPTSGQVLVDGVDPFENAAIMGQVAFVGEMRGDSTAYTVRDALAFIARLRPTWDAGYADRLVDRFELPRRSSIGKLSRGKRAALGAVCGLAARAPVTLFDEPHLGLDVPSRYAFYEELLEDYLAHPRTIVLSTHHVDEVAKLLGEVVIIERGRLLLHADTDSLRGRGTEVVGPAAVVDRFTAPLTVLSERTLGDTKAAVTYGALTDDQRDQARRAGVTLGPIPLQDLVAHLTPGAAGATPADREKERAS